MPDVILAIDQGTTSSRALVFDANAEVVALAQAEFPQRYPAEGWVEHDPEAIWSTTVSTAREATAAAEANGGRIAAIGLANQRETTLVWDSGQESPSTTPSSGRIDARWTCAGGLKGTARAFSTPIPRPPGPHGCSTMWRARD